jgi:hypothetical protein
MVISTPIAGSSAAVIAATVASPAVVTPSTVVAPAIIAASVVAVVPGTGTDEDAAAEIVRTVISIWSASVRIVGVITVSADGRAGYVAITVVTVVVVIIVVAVVIARVVVTRVVVTRVVVIIVTGVSSVSRPDSHAN